MEPARSELCGVSTVEGGPGWTNVGGTPAFYFGRGSPGQSTGPHAGDIGDAGWGGGDLAALQKYLRVWIDDRVAAPCLAA